MKGVVHCLAFFIRSHVYINVAVRSSGVGGRQTHLSKKQSQALSVNRMSEFAREGEILGIQVQRLI